ncbi:DUF3891 family protein [Paenibacillus sp. J5C_2022]|uniref:DUF3891 family protein n=1 Tax=Paenibacillus sp. J5C2022 TaxID=2977129 RepID=UPI0021D3118A|nr:DUF3891 family protein [Paenibacillus sp. J5C2022]MCU6707411.1 DUF3891 family protein [Paenibacillus sp. J5C2022]
MIIREEPQHFIMIAQHDHGQLSGEIATSINPSYFIDEKLRDTVIKAIYEHDRGWIKLDETPIWHDAASRPFTFEDYPLAPKLQFYGLGIDEIEEKNLYGGLLCSMHFSTFELLRQSDQEDCVAFCAREDDRQKRLREQLGSWNEEALMAHFKILQLCDDLSLYVCLNHAGAAKEEEHPWFRDGFKHADYFTGRTDGVLMASWLSCEEVRVTPEVFATKCQAKLLYKRVAKEEIKRFGIHEAYLQSPLLEQVVAFS